ncbi:MAG: hypothetical protein FJ298_07410 [Planctomycetes bacterium]|nr:hypothetical protein [Planctomycetota bacterium]
MSFATSILAVLVSLPGLASRTGPGDALLPAVDAYISLARDRTIAAALAQGATLPPDFIAWIEADPLRAKSVYGCRKDPLSVLLALRSLEIDLGADTVRRSHTQLALAFALQNSYTPARTKAGGWNDGDDGADGQTALSDVSPRAPLALAIPPDPRVPVDTKDPSRALDVHDHVVNFLEDHAQIEVEIAVQELPPLEYDEKGVAKPQRKAVTVMKTVLRKPFGADVIASAALQAEFNAYLAAHGHAQTRLDCGDRTVHWYSKDGVSDKDLRARIKAAHELFHDAYRAKGRMPAERDRAPTMAESMAWFVRNDRHAFDDATRAARQWPRFPLDAPWPLLMMLVGDDQPLREREDIWARFRDTGELRTYGEYIGGIAQQFDMQSARRVAPIAFSYGSIQMMWKDGGVCGTMGNIGARTHRIVGQPASTAGQPGHCALVFMERDAKTGEFLCRGGQYATGGDEVTTVHAGWNYDDRGGRRPMVFHQSVAWGVNAGFESFVDTLVLLRVYEALPPLERARRAATMVDEGLARNPFAIALVEAALAAATDSGVALAVLDAFDARVSANDAARERELYRTTVRDLAHARVLALTSSADAKTAHTLLAALERQSCTNPRLLAHCWRGIGGEQEFNARTLEAARRYVASSERAKSKRDREEFTAMARGWADSVNGKTAKATWAAAMLEPFVGSETIEVRGKKPLTDPALEALRKIAGTPPPPANG